jgi:hypothetical protein
LDGEIIEGENKVFEVEIIPGGFTIWAGAWGRLSEAPCFIHYAYDGICFSAGLYRYGAQIAQKSCSIFNYPWRRPTL